MITITKEDLQTISFDEENSQLKIKWYTGGQENAVCGLILKVELVEKIISGYKYPHIQYDPEYREAF